MIQEIRRLTEAEGMFPVISRFEVRVLLDRIDTLEEALSEANARALQGIYTQSRGEK
jgi:hypothetical protein